MRRRTSLRGSRLRRGALAAPVLLAFVLGDGLAEAAASTAGSSAGGAGGSIQIKVRRRRIGYGQRLTVTGRAPSTAGGQRVRLDFTPAGSSKWRPVAQGRVGANGRFRLQARLRRSGRVKVKGLWHPASAQGGSGGSSTTGGASGASSPSRTASDDPSSSTQPASRPRRVSVSARLRVAGHATDDLGGHPITVRGTLQPGAGGRRVHLQALVGHRWHEVARGRTGARGRFAIRYVPRSGKKWLRISFGGDHANGPATARAGTVTVFTRGVASWYQDGGTTACGFHAHYGVANVSLPCGTKVTFVYGGHRVTATVDDRGPYVGGRKWDLNQNTAGALGFDGVASVWASR